MTNTKPSKKLESRNAVETAISLSRTAQPWEKATAEIQTWDQVGCSQSSTNATDNESTKPPQP